MSSSVSRLVRFYPSLSEAFKSTDNYDSDKAYYGVLSDNQKAVVGTKVRILEGNIYNSHTWRVSNVTKTIGKVLAPIDPCNIFCVGLNYKMHANESQMAIPDYPVIFSKPTTAVCNPNESICIPHCCAVDNPGEVDYEVELVIVIGKKCKNVSENEALDYILGYTVGNDVSARIWQLNKEKSGGQWNRGKSFDTFAPLGPCMLLQNGKHSKVNPNNLDLWCTLNGKPMQRSNTSDMIFNVQKLVSFISSGTTLMPGTVIFTGTPGGIGLARNPPCFMHPGDIVVAGVDHIGELCNVIKADKLKAAL